MTQKIIPVSDFRRQTSQVIDSILREGDVVYITQHGRPKVVLLDYQQYEALLANQAVSPDSRESGLMLAITVSAEEARQHVNRQVIPDLGTGLRAGSPALLWREQQLFWQVSILLSLPQLGEMGAVGAIRVDAHSGVIEITAAELEQIRQHAQRLYDGATLSIDNMR